jgi:3-dehydroquinate dehydratase-2
MGPAVTSPQPIVAVLNGPNLNLLGLRQPELYGRTTLADVQAMTEAKAAALGLAVEFRQSNLEGELIGWVQACRGRAAGIVINPAGYTHTSVALLDALLASELPVIEVHLTNIHRREPFRQTSITGKAATGMIAGLGPAGYVLALEAMAGLFREAAKERPGGTA